MFDILTLLPGSKKTTSSGWVTFNGVCCSHLGHKADTRHRGGVKSDGTTWVYHCFNCNFSCGFELGKPITKKTRQLLQWSGTDTEQIQRWNLESIQHKNALDLVRAQPIPKLTFLEKKLPPGEWLVDTKENEKYITYLTRRSIEVGSDQFLITPDQPGRNGNRIIIPFYFDNRVVGHASRFLDNKIPKYLNDSPTGYIYGYDKQKPNWEVCILVEGIFDAISIDGCAYMHNTISNEQVRLLAHMNKKIIVVPDQDKAGMSICDKAIELGFSISIPSWHDDIKDVNDAVVRYGKLPTLMSILQSATTSKIKLQIRRNKLGL